MKFTAYLFCSVFSSFNASAIDTLLYCRVMRCAESGRQKAQSIYIIRCFMGLVYVELVALKGDIDAVEGVEQVNLLLQVEVLVPLEIQSDVA